MSVVINNWTADLEIVDNDSDWSLWAWLWKVCLRKTSIKLELWINSSYVWLVSLWTHPVRLRYTDIDWTPYVDNDALYSAIKTMIYT